MRDWRPVANIALPPHTALLQQTHHDDEAPPPMKGWGLVLLGTDGSAGRLGLDTAEQPPQRDVDSVRHFLPLEGPDIVHGLGDEVVRQLKGVRDVRVGGVSAH